VNPEPGPSTDATAGAAPTAGALLRAAREKQGLHIAALAASIKIAPRKLEALEANRLGELPDATFARALAQTVCRTLKIDPRPVLERLPAAGPQPLLLPDAGINEPYRESAARMARPRGESPRSAFAMKPMFWAAALLLVASVALYLVPLDGWRDGPLTPTPVPATPALVAVPATPALVAVPAAPALVAVPAAILDSAVSAASAVPLAASASAPASAPATSFASPLTPAGATPAAAAVETVFAAPPAGAEPATTAATGALQLRVREASWIEVRDGRGSSLLSRTVQPGEQIGLDGAPPLALVIGNVAATDLVFRGKPVDLAARSRQNVARFQLP
jgi:cytoskeleton protein RodZ